MHGVLIFLAQNRLCLYLVVMIVRYAKTNLCPESSPVYLQLHGLESVQKKSNIGWDCCPEEPGKPVLLLHIFYLILFNSGNSVLLFYQV